ncbi:macro domain-containing protein [Streptomyces sp. NPDC001851]|uniref:macro domain-containing protein n=1 Tax=Streptomyces sp. NPDC001851 TaxID=3154529 RepID=UPI00332060DF
MTLVHREGDLFSAQDAEALAHGCNCAGAMGRGIAVEFKNRWPDMYATYRRKCQDGEFPVGACFPWKTPQGLVIYNLGTQRHWRAPARLPDVVNAVEAMCTHAVSHGISRIAMPRIASGLGRLTWAEVEKAITPAVESKELTVIVYRFQSDET